MRKFRYIPLLVLGLYLLTGLAQIRPEERALVRRFGKVVAHPGPGLWIGWPYGIDRIDRVPTAMVRRVMVGDRPDALADDGAGPLLTGDQNLVQVHIAVDYSVGESQRDLEDFVAERDRVDAVIAREAEAALAEWIGARPIDDVLLTGSAALPPYVTRRVAERLAPLRLGIRVQQTSVVALTPPEEVRSAFEEVNTAQAAARAQEQRAHQEAARMLRDAEASAYQDLQQAQAYAAGRKAAARADADTFRKRLDQYRALKASNPDVLQAIWWDEMTRLWRGFRQRGRVELLDSYLGPDGLDLSTIVPPRKR